VFAQNGIFRGLRHHLVYYYYYYYFYYYYSVKGNISHNVIAFIESFVCLNICVFEPFVYKICFLQFQYEKSKMFSDTDICYLRENILYLEKKSKIITHFYKVINKFNKIKGWAMKLKDFKPIPP
jgi:hypothetical protein